MSDKQTTAVVALVILSLIFYLYNAGRLSQVVSGITGKTTTTKNNISTVAANLAGNTEVAQNANYDGVMQGLQTGYFLNSIYGIGDNGTIVYGSSGGNGGDKGLASLASAAGSIATIASLI